MTNEMKDENTNERIKQDAYRARFLTAKQMFGSFTPFYGRSGPRHARDPGFAETAGNHATFFFYRGCSTQAPEVG